MKITTIGVSVSKKLDVGFKPYLDYMKACRAAKVQVPFGTRENSNLELNVYLGATVDEGEDVEACVAELAGKANRLVDESVTSITGIAQVEEAFTVEKTEVTREISEV